MDERHQSRDRQQHECVGPMVWLIWGKFYVCRYHSVRSLMSTFSVRYLLTMQDHRVILKFCLASRGIAVTHCEIIPIAPLSDAEQAVEFYSIL